VFAWGAVVPLVRADDHWPGLLLGAVFSATPVGFGIGTVAGGRLADRHPPRILCWASLGLLAAGFALAFAAPSGLTFVVGYAGVGLGVGGGIALTGAVAALAQVLPGRPGLAGGLPSAVYASSAVFQAPLVAALAPSVGWRDALAAVGIGVAVVAAVLLTLMPALPARRAGPEGGLLLTRPVGTGAALAFCGATLGAYAAVNLPGEAGLALAGAVAAAIALGNATGRLLGGLLADRLGTGRVVVAAVFALRAGGRARGRAGRRPGAGRERRHAGPGGPGRGAGAPERGLRAGVRRLHDRRVRGPAAGRGGGRPAGLAGDGGAGRGGAGPAQRRSSGRSGERTRNVMQRTPARATMPISASPLLGKTRRRTVEHSR